MTWLCRLVTPPNGVVLDPFCGSGSTGRGGIHVGAAQFIGIDISEDYLEIARRRIEAARHPMDSLLS
jgi:site-specific DNA-methyltransferase (adenine-specific)